MVFGAAVDAGNGFYRSTPTMRFNDFSDDGVTSWVELSGSFFSFPCCFLGFLHGKVMIPSL